VCLKSDADDAVVDASVISNIRRLLIGSDSVRGPGVRGESEGEGERGIGLPGQAVSSSSSALHCWLPVPTGL
jgi:hypothetical protein